jgi:hypothetical protein
MSCRSVKAVDDVHWLKARRQLVEDGANVTLDVATFRTFLINAVVASTRLHNLLETATERLLPRRPVYQPIPRLASPSAVVARNLDPQFC